MEVFETKKILAIVVLATILFVCFAVTYAKEATFISLSEVCKIAWDEGVYRSGLMYVTVTFTEANSILLEINVDSIRVDYHLLENDEWCFYEGGILIHKEVLPKLLEEIS